MSIWCMPATMGGPKRTSSTRSTTRQAFLFVRFLYHVDRGAWRLIHVDLKIEDELPFPKDWLHIYPQ